MGYGPYKTKYDRVKNETVEWSKYFTKKEREWWKSLESLPDLQRHQSGYKTDNKGVYRELYGKKKYYTFHNRMRKENVK